MRPLEISVSIGELLDKITILKIKQEKIQDEEKLKNINEELNYLQMAMNKINLDSHSLLKMDELQKVNEELWLVEDQLRNFEKLKYFGEEFILLARSVYLKNDYRSQLKKELNLHLGSRFVEEKSYSDYQSSNEVNQSLSH